MGNIIVLSCQCVFCYMCNQYVTGHNSWDLTYLLSISIKRRTLCVWLCVRARVYSSKSRPSSDSRLEDEVHGFKRFYFQGHHISWFGDTTHFRRFLNSWMLYVCYKKMYNKSISRCSYCRG
jgi:hypothetical protein